MTFLQTRYIIDTNVLNKIDVNERSTQFFKTRCSLPDAVLDEASGFPDIEELRKLRYPTTAPLLQLLMEVMATIELKDKRVVNLWKNKGAADPVLTAVALHARAQEKDRMLEIEWVIVTDDRAVRNLAEKHEVEVLSGDQFQEILRRQM
ncbi:hypothetical protein FPH17_02740 [Corynebacterium godavarianum]|uniref:PIN domain-containing protein n=1 Tax=Corynebacterium godavarianum TaxID=2054421 RepID=A0ABY3E6E8_9CORY|nr:hypothetical protein [Corynebacterium godavarianum]MBL7285817.1 hypothetical protein [Corynebacterium godavarianum]TSJ75356.1 hypothetical protein FPH17_02740 [Corynebacterium godavarianum]